MRQCNLTFHTVKTEITLPWDLTSHIVSIYQPTRCHILWNFHKSAATSGYFWDAGSKCL